MHRATPSCCNACAGLGAVQPRQGLQALLLLLGGPYQLVTAVASPINWPALASTRKNLAYALEEFSERPKPAPLMPVLSAASPHRRQAAGMHLSQGLEKPAGKDVQAAVASIAHGILGAAVDAAQPLMEVS